MSSALSSTVTRLLNRLHAGDSAARRELFEVVYGELRDIAASLMRKERGNHTLQPTALVNEAYLRLDREKVLERPVNRNFFFAAAVRAMHQILVDSARKRNAQKRGGDRQRLQLDLQFVAQQGDTTWDVLDLDEQLKKLEAIDRRQYDMVMLRYYAGVEYQDIADCLELSVSTVEKQLRAARAWLFQQLGGSS